MTIDEYLNKLKSLCCEIYGLDSVATISKSRIKRIIFHDLRSEFRSFVTIIQGWPTQTTIEEFENLLANQEAIDKQIGRALAKNDEETLFTYKKRHQFR